MESLTDLVVVEIAGSVAGAYCAKMFADQGATVYLVGERTLPDFQQRYYDEHKISAGFDEVDAASIDVVIESDGRRRLTPRVIDAPQAMRVQVTPFGMTGLRSQWQSTDLVDYAISGHSYLYGHPDREPLRGPPDQPAVAAGLFAFVGAMAGLLARDRLGRGQTVDVSHHDVMVALHQVTLIRHLMSGDVLCRMGNRYTGQGQPNGPYRCSDGWVSVACVTNQQIESLLLVAGLTHVLDHDDIDSPMDLHVRPELLEGPLVAWLLTQQVDEVVELLQAMRVPAAPLLDTAELLDDAQLNNRNFFRPLADGSGVQVPRGPFTLSHQQVTDDRRWEAEDLAQGPLAGLRVLDLARVWAGPLCARILSDLGAQVDWLEAPWSRGPKAPPESFAQATRCYPNDELGVRPWNRNAHWVKYSLGKRSLSLDLQTERGQQVLGRLVPRYHVLLENFSSRVMPQFGFDEDRLHALNPDLVYLTMPGFGRSGPAEHWLAYGSSVDSHAGLSSLIGYRDQVPWKGGIAWPDPIAGLHACCAVLAALWASTTRGTGGVTIEGAQFESTVAAIGDRVVQAQLHGPYRPDGNRQPGYAAQGVYRCAGDDEWIAISMPAKAELVAVSQVLGIEISPVADHDAIDTAISGATSGWVSADLAEELQAVGVPAAAVVTAPVIMADEHLRSRGLWATVDQPDMGEFTAPIAPVGLADTAARVVAAAPTLGEDNVAILAEAGFAAHEIDALLANGVITTEPPD